MQVLYCKEATALDCWDSEEWSAKYGETADNRESMRMAEFGYYTSDSETDDEPLLYEPDYVPNFEFDSTESYVEFCIDGL